MRVVRGIGWFFFSVVVVLVAAPVLALVPAALVDRGADGTVRSTLVYAALATFDPFVWLCIWNSLTYSVVVAFGSWWIGVGLARVIVRWRFWGRGPLALLASVPLAVTPMFGAIGLRSLIVDGNRWPWEDAAEWLAWLWVGLAWGVPLVLLSTRAALLRVDPAWEDAAHLAGATRRQVWWNVTWPIVRPETSRTVAAVFTCSLLEPGAPLALGLRRTLAFQVVETALGGPATAPRAAALALWAVALAGLGRLLVRWWGRAPWPIPPIAPETRPRRVRWLTGLALVILLSGCVTLLLAPMASLVANSLAPEAGVSATSQHSISALLERLRGDPEAHRLAANSLGLGAGAACIGLALSLALAAPAARRTGRWAAASRFMARLTEAFPPLAIGVGALTIPVLLGAAADGPRSGQGAPASELRWLADHLDPNRSPGILLVGVLALVHLPMLSRAAELGIRETHPRLVDSARTLGASWRRARRGILGMWLGAAPGAAFIVAVALAATSLVPALVLAPTSEARPVGPAILNLADEPGGGLRRAADLATAAIALNLTAFALANRRRVGPLGAWFRG